MVQVSGEHLPSRSARVHSMVQKYAGVFKQQGLCLTICGGCWMAALLLIREAGNRAELIQDLCLEV